MTVQNLIDELVKYHSGFQVCVWETDKLLIYNLDNTNQWYSITLGSLDNGEKNAL